MANTELVKNKLANIDKNVDIKTRVLMGITSKHVSPDSQLVGDEVFE